MCVCVGLVDPSFLMLLLQTTSAGVKRSLKGRRQKRQLCYNPLDVWRRGALLNEISDGGGREKGVGVHNQV